MVFAESPWSGSGTISQTGPNLCHTITYTLQVIASSAGFPKEVFLAHSYSSSIQMFTTHINRFKMNLICRRYNNIYCPSRNPKELQRNTENDTRALSDWFNAYKLS